MHDQLNALFQLMTWSKWGKLYTFILTASTLSDKHHNSYLITLKDNIWPEIVQQLRYKKNCNVADVA